MISEICDFFLHEVLPFVVLFGLFWLVTYPDRR